MEKYRPPAFQFYVRDFLTDRAVVLMTPEERGAYIMLLCHAWLSPEPGVLLERDCESMSGLEIVRWSMCRSALARAFDTVSRPGYWVQKRLTATFKEMDRYRKQKQDAGIRGAESRWQRHSPAKVLPMANDSSASATASASSIESKEEAERLPRPPRKSALSEPPKAFDPAFVSEMEAKFPTIDVPFEAAKALDYCASSGKRYSDYQAFLRNWLRRGQEELEREAARGKR